MKSFVLMIALFAGVAAGSFAQDTCNPRPCPDDLVLPMPNGLRMVFRPVYLNVGAGPLAVREIILGGRADEGFRENPTKVAIGGSFLGKNAGKPDWLFFLGKYEVTEEQFATVIPSSGRVGPQEARPRGSLPKVDVTWLEIENFLQSYNLWLFANSRDALPMADGQPGFVRLPTEVEWEFAARGGSAVEDSRFDQKTPYDGDLARYEWFAGAHSSHDELQPIGLLEPNPLGLHDMLGNAAELVSNLYQIEYIQGRAGALTVRGGSFRSEEGDLRSSLRTEQRLYTTDWRPAHADSLGFRIVLASSIFTSTSMVREIEAAWPAYHSSRDAPKPSAVSTAPKSEQTNVALQDIDGILAQLEATLKARGGIPEAAQAKINLIRSSFADINANIVNGEEKAAQGGVRLASIASQVMVTSLQGLEADQELLKEDKPDEQQTDNDDLKKRKANIEDSRRTYEIACQQLNQISREAVERNFDAWIAELEHRSIKDTVLATEVAKQNYLEYFKTKRSVVDRWQQDLQSLAAKLSNRAGTGQ